MVSPLYHPSTRKPRPWRRVAFWLLLGVLLLISVLVMAGVYPLPVGPDCRFAPRETGPAAAFPDPVWRWVEASAAGYSGEGLERAAAHLRVLPATGVLVAANGRVLMECGDVRHVSYLASVRKSILAILYGKYVADGTIDLEATLADLEMDDHGGLLPIEKQATVKHLISARSGVYHAASNPGDSLAFAPPRGSQQPGTYYLYSNWDFNAAGGAFETATGRDLFDALQADLAEPIGMQDFDRSRQRKLGDTSVSVYPAYHMWLSTRDMARVGLLMLREGEWNGRRVVPAEWVRRTVDLVTPLQEMNPEQLRDDDFGYGYMWWVYDGPRARGVWEGAYSARGAFGQYITVVPKLDLVVAYKTDPDPAAHPGFWSRLRYGVLPFRPVTGWDEYQALLDLLAAARCEGECP